MSTPYPKYAKLVMLLFGDLGGLCSPDHVYNMCYAKILTSLYDGFQNYFSCEIDEKKKKEIEKPLTLHLIQWSVSRKKFRKHLLGRKPRVVAILKLLSVFNQMFF